MKRILCFSIIILGFCRIIDCQNVSLLNGYKYVYVPTLKYKDGDIDKWSLSKYANISFSSMGFVVLNEQTQIPDEIKNDPCLLLQCNIDHSNVITGVNTVSLTLKNCKNEIIFNETGGGMGFSLQQDYDQAFLKIAKKLKIFDYYFNPNMTPEMTYPNVERTTENEQSIKTYLSSSNLDIIEGIYKSSQSEGMPYYKFGIIKTGEKFKAIILESDQKQWKQGEVKSYFEPSSMKGIYSAKWYMGNKTSYETFASMENFAVLTIELKNPNGDKRVDKFIKMFPPLSESKQSEKEIMTSGSGFFVSVDGIVATNAHLIEDAGKISITVSNEIGTYDYSAKVLLVDKNNDVALLKIIDENFKGLSVIPYGISDKSDVGETVFTIGYPLNDVMGTNFKVTDGIISSKSGISDDIRFLQITVPLQPGNSGGPLFNKTGNVIGITTARLNSDAVGTQIENVNYAIKASYLINLYGMLPESQKLNSNSSIIGKELKDQVKILKNYVCLIEVQH
jgi:S1-C subfamily serine protease